MRIGYKRYKYTCLKEIGLRPHIVNHSTLNDEYNWELDLGIQLRNQQTLPIARIESREVHF